MAGETNIFGIANLEAVEDKVAKFVEAFGRQYGFTAKDVMTQVMRMWVLDVMKLTPPYSGSQLAGMGASGEGSARMVGKKAVERDLRKIFMPISESSNDAKRWWTSHSGELFFKRDDGGVMRVIPDQLRFLKGKAAQSDMQNWHTQFRGPNGRVKKSTSMAFVRENQFKKYLNAEKRAVGRLKAGWVPAIRAFGGAIPPGWITANPRGQAGRAVSAMDDKGNGYLESVNSVPYAFRKLIGIARASGVTRMKHLDRAMRTKAGEQLIGMINKHKTVEEATTTMNGGRMVAA